MVKAHKQRTQPENQVHTRGRQHPRTFAYVLFAISTQQPELDHGTSIEHPVAPLLGRLSEKPTWFLEHNV